MSETPTPAHLIEYMKLQRRLRRPAAWRGAWLMLVSCLL